MVIPSVVFFICLFFFILIWDGIHLAKQYLKGKWSFYQLMIFEEESFCKAPEGVYFDSCQIF